MIILLHRKLIIINFMVIVMINEEMKKLGATGSVIRSLAKEADELKAQLEEAGATVELQ